MPGWKGHARHGYSKGRHRNARPSLHSALRPPPERGTQDLQTTAVHTTPLDKATSHEPQRGISHLRVQTTIPVTAQGYDRSPAGDAIEATPTESSIPHSTIYIESLKRRFTGAAHGAAALRLLVSAELLDFASKSNLRSICIYYEFHESPSSVVACRSTPIHSPQSPAFAPLHRHATQRGRNQCQSHASRDTLHMGWLRTHCKC